MTALFVVLNYLPQLNNVFSSDTLEAKKQEHF